MIYIKDKYVNKTYVSKNSYFLTTIKEINKKTITPEEIINFVDNLYSKGVHILNIITYLEKYKDIDEIYKYKLLSFIDLARHHIYNDKIIMYMLLHYFFLRCEIKLENIMIN